MAQKKGQNSRKKSSGGKSGGGSPLGKILIVLLIVGAVFAYRKCRSAEPNTGASSGEAQSAPSGIEETLGSIGEALDGIVGTTTEVETTTTATPSQDDDGASQDAQPHTAGTVALPKGLEYPACEGGSGKKDHQRRQLTHYALCYRESYEQAEWSAYRLTEAQLDRKAKRTDDFREDPEIKTQSATPADYKGTGYDRGHLTPAADMGFDKKAMSETFYMSNMSPQAGPFNRGIWRLLEEQVRGWTQKFGRVYVVSGPILDKPASKLKKIGKSNVSVPERYYKVILAPLYADDKDRRSPEDAADVAAIGFILPNDECKGKKFWDYAVSVDEVEKATGIDFFDKLDDAAEKRAESRFDAKLWK